MTTYKASAIAHPNIAFIKYWGNQGSEWNIPFGNSISMNLDAFVSETTVEFDNNLDKDQLTLNNKSVKGDGLDRTITFMDKFRELFDFNIKANITSKNNFPTGAGIASSASGYAALALATLEASQVEYQEKDASALARIGSGSASRSIPDGFTEWLQGDSHETSYSVSIASQDHWNLEDSLILIDTEHKKITSKQGHGIAASSVLQDMRIKGIEERITICRQSILDKDFETLADISEADTLLMHTVMMSSNPALFYLQPYTLEVIRFIRELRAEGVNAFYTIDAGANVHMITTSDHTQKAIDEVKHNYPDFEIRSSKTGGAAKIA